MRPCSPTPRRRGAAAGQPSPYCCAAPPTPWRRPTSCRLRVLRCPPEGELADPMARVTLQTIADAVGVSRMTVSNAFSKPDQLSASLRDRILAVAEQLGYVGPDPTARALASGTTGTIGLLMSDTLHYTLTDEVAMAFVAAITDELAPTGLAL